MGLLSINIFCNEYYYYYYQIDVDQNDETAESQGIEAMPTFIFYKKGRKIDSIRGANEAKLREMLAKYA